MCKQSTSPSPSPSSKSKALQLTSIRKALPQEVFIKSLFLSFFYLFVDAFMWLGALFIALRVAKSDSWNTMEEWQKGLFTILYWNFTGFFMWCLFVVGHDCGHGTFSEYEWLNDLIGNLTHGALLVPYWPWQMTHRRHHMYHNHVEKDYSHPWYTPERMALPQSSLARFFHQYSYLLATFPYYGWTLYLLGLPDGSHFIPHSSGRMWKDSDTSDCIKGIISTFFVIGWSSSIYGLCGYSLASLTYYYLIPILVFGWWLVTVTYLQHHAPDTLVHNDETWKFVDAAFETVDREYGYGIDYWSHHITDGHVIHHLFFTKIPHYHLYQATQALKKYLSENGLSSIYKVEKTHDFFSRVHRYFISNGLRAVLYRPDGSHLQQQEKKRK